MNENKVRGMGGTWGAGEFGPTTAFILLIATDFSAW